MKRIPNPLLPILFLLSATPLLAQQPYTQKQFSYFVEKDIPFGSATGFAGQQVELVLDLYKPIGDDNCQRPLLVMAHGGGFIGGSRKDNDVVRICEEMAARGYAAASIEYRLGVHPYFFYEPYALCNDAINPVGISKCIYMADTMEFYRGAARAVQDMRAAIRFLKGRNGIDSTDVRNVFIGGSSAGAITALHTGLYDLFANETMSHTGSLPDAPVPDPDLASCVPGPADRTRPDLGPLEGEVLVGNGHDSRVQGVAGFMGAVFDLGILEGDTPPLYLYHRTDDLVVPSNSAQLFGLYPHCFNPINLCQPLSTRPWVSGSAAIRDRLTALGSTDFFNDILDNYGPADGDDCLDNPANHSIDNIPLRCEHLSGFFAGIIGANGNVPTANCVSAAEGHVRQVAAITLSPNPVANGLLNIRCDQCPAGATLLQLCDAMGRPLRQALLEQPVVQWGIGDLPSGVYFLKALVGGKWRVERLVVGGGQR
jgi:acetyl esterase/lipase